MGAEFVQKAAGSFRKSWDKGRLALGTADLFTREPDCAARAAAFDIAGNARLEAGSQLPKVVQGVTFRNGVESSKRQHRTPPDHGVTQISA